ncbi:FAD-dependent oxidoreductase [Paenibacillus sp. 1001270B_150601_E10]|uniref:FAD-dependent oxidoreductase n=1 Tax=Paenibacillus sp. 1001270B_150601_E10 TaxID=2787079 RepID=UPI00189C5D0E|nr:FAD-dependent oxidoreductase [Paenibacillus sp. 1001270B_150601_E10]
MTIARERCLEADLCIIGGGTGGTAAALAAARAGKTVIMTEETSWIGGQFTSQAVPPDEHPWIESFGSTRSYRQFREQVRAYYRDNFPMQPTSRAQVQLNPGNGTVSRLCHEPRTALAVLHQMLAPYIHSGKIILLTEHILVQAHTAGNQVDHVIVQCLNTKENMKLKARFYLDATECGDLLPAAGIDYVTGAESKAETGEPHAVDGEAIPQDMQGFTYCFAMDYMENESHLIAKPAFYDQWKAYKPSFWPDRLLSFTALKPSTNEPIQYELFPGYGRFSLYQYRQIADQKHFAAGTYKSNITLVNWPQNDYWLGSIIDVSPEEREHHLFMAKQLSFSLLYWLQTEAPRPDGGQGYPGLRLRPDVVGTSDGMAMYPYIRESRRIKAEFTVLEQHVATDLRPEGKAEPFFDSVGIGCYRIDLHPSTMNRPYIDISSLPFEIPLGSLIPSKMDNVLAAAKNIGVTHITNGCYRLHPVEWNIGEAAALCAAYCINKNATPRAVRQDSAQLAAYQQLLVQHGIELHWPTIRPV